MRNRIITLFLTSLWALLPGVIHADSPIEDGVYSINCTKLSGWLGLGFNHDADPYIYYVTDGSDVGDDGWWTVTNTPQGYTFRNASTDELLVFTYDRADLYYKYMTLSRSSLGDGSEYWNIIQGADGAYSIQSVLDTDYYWNLRSGSNMLGTYKGSNGTSNNERFVFTKKADTPDPTPVISWEKGFPEALHVFLSGGRIEAFPIDCVTAYEEREGQLVVETNVGQNFTYDLAEVDSVGHQAPTDFPTFDVFRFNKNSNDQLLGSVVATMEADTVRAEIGAIGKRLTPTFTLTDATAAAYVKGQLQTSGQSRLRFQGDVYYTVARPGQTMLLPSPEADGTYAMMPYGRMVRVSVSWLTDAAQVPTIYIDTEDGLAITSKDYYKNATITIDGHGIFPSMEATAVQIKGRGNSSWAWPKKPYRLKFAEKLKPLGMKKGKSWVLLSNYQTGSLMSNAIGMKAANLLGATAANHIVPVDLYLNGEYRGSYNFTEKVGFSNNSVDLADESAAAMLELDSYFDETYKFRSSPYNLPINIKEPDFADAETVTNLTPTIIQRHFNSFLSNLYRGKDISQYVDLEQLARFLMVNELTLNYELYHPKSTFCYHENMLADSCKYIFGPVWDLDWCFGYERARSYFANESTSNYWTDMPEFEARNFVRDLRFKYEPLDTLYRSLWEKFMQDGLQELEEYAQDYYDFARNSFNSNAQKWGDRTNYAQQAQTAATWLQARADKIYADIMAGVRPDAEQPVESATFDNTKLYAIYCKRGALVLTADHKGLTVEQARNYSYTDDEAQFAILNIGGSNYLYSPTTKMFLAYYGNGTWVNQLGTPIVFDPSSPNGDFKYMMRCNADGGGTLFFNHNNSILVINTFSNPDDGNRWIVEEVGSFDPTEAIALASQSLFAVTNRYIWHGEPIGTESFQIPRGAEPPAPTERWDNAFVTLTEPADMPYQITADATFDYEVEWHGPFLFSTSPDDASWYNMTIRSDYHVGRQATEPYYPKQVDESTLIFDPDYYWAFGGNPYQVTLYNYTKGFGETLSAVGDYVAMRQGEFAWDLLPNRDGFVLRLPGTVNTCINQFGSTEGPLQLWDNTKSLTDNGSTFRLFEGLVDGIAKVQAESKAVKVLRDGHIYILRDGKTFRTDGTEVGPKR